MSESSLIALFIVLAILIALSILFIIFFPKLYKKHLRKNFVSVYGKQVYKLALHEDYYLINRLLLKTMDGTTIDIDHFLCGNKYIYVIKDYYFEGALSAKEYDHMWWYYKKDKKISEIVNYICPPVIISPTPILERVPFDLCYEVNEIYSYFNSQQSALLKPISARSISRLWLRRICYTST